MKALYFSQTGDLSHLQYCDQPQPQVSSQEALIQIHAARLNKNDISNVSGRMPYTTLPRIPGRDYAGVVIKGPDPWLGQWVWGSGCDNGFTRDGSHAQYMCVNVSALSLKPETLTAVQAANCGTPFITAWHAIENCGVTKDMRVAVIGAHGAVGHAACELAKLRGANTLGLVRNETQCSSLKAQGLSVELLPVGDGSKKLTDIFQSHFGALADVIIDTSGAWLAPSISALSRFGSIGIIVAPGNGEVQFNARELYRNGSRIVGINSLLYSGADCAKVFDELKPAFEAQLIHPYPHIQTHPLSQAIQAYQDLQKGSGKQHVFLPFDEE